MATRALLATAAFAGVAAAALAPAAHAQNLSGSQVTVAGYCCTAPPGPGTQATNAVTATVGPTVEFPLGTFTSLTSTLETLPVAIDVGANEFAINYSSGGVAAPGGFNGFIFTFAGAPAITGVTLDAASSSGYTPQITFTANQVFINEAGLTLTSTSSGVFDVTTAVAPPPVPEPETYAMLLSGLALLGWTARRRRG